MWRMGALLEVSDYCLLGGQDLCLRVPRLQLDRGEVAALHAPSGGGKTSLLEAFFGLLDRRGWCVQRGTVRLDGRDVAACSRAERTELLRRRMAFLMQDAQGALDPLVRIEDQIRAATDAPRDRMLAELARLGIDDPAGLCARPPHRVSGGQAQRVLLAIAFLREPALVVADEPSASLDGGSYQELLRRLQELVARGSALLLATHDPRLSQDLGATVYSPDPSVDGGAFVPAALQPVAWPRRGDRVAPGEPVLEARGVEVAFAGRPVLRSVDLDVRAGEVVALLGESGAGKTTLLRVLAEHREPDRGVVRAPHRRTAVQLVCQDARAALTPGRRLDSLLAEASVPDFAAVDEARAVRLDPAVLARAGDAMSGGERRRAGLLRALAVRPDVLLLDEPTASLDRDAAVAVIDTLLQVQRRRQLAIVLATHDEALAAAIADRSLKLEGGVLCAT